MTNGNTSSREKNKHLPMVLCLKIRWEDKQNFVEFAVLLSLAVTGILIKTKQKRNNKECMISTGWFFLKYILHPLCDSVNIAKT